MKTKTIAWKTVGMGHKMRKPNGNWKVGNCERWLEMISFLPKNSVRIVTATSPTQTIGSLRGVKP